VGVRPGLQRDLSGRVHLVRHSSKHQRETRRGIMASRGDPLLLHHDDLRLSSRHLTKDHSSSSSVARNNSHLGLFNRTDQVSKPVGRHLLLRVPGLLGRRRGVGRVGSHTTSATVLWRGPGHLDQLDLLQWEIWARPIRFMQR
jgi:hypothetical protein